jgi:hypothetical protein
LICLADPEVLYLSFKGIKMMNNVHAYTHRIICKITAVLLLLTSAVPSSALPIPFSENDDVPEYPVYDIRPSSGVPGREYLINIISHNPNTKAITDKTQIFAPGGIAISGVRVVSNNALSAKITIPEDTTLGRTQFLLKDKEGPEGTIIGIAEFDIIAIAQGAIPNGLDPEVDVMWGVMAEKVVMHNFGHKIAKHYYGIQLSIGNNTGFDLQISSVGFQLPRNTGINNRVPTNSYRATRGTLERQQQIGTRAKLVNSFKAFGLLFTGFLPFWKAVGPSANAARFADIINGPLEGG